MVNITILNKQDAVKYTPKEKSIAIRITDKNSNFVTGFPYERYIDVLELKFHDADPEYFFTETLKKNLFSEEDTYKIFDFLKDKKIVNEVVVHCDYGHSRSVTVALFIAENFLPQYDSELVIEDINRGIEDGKYRINQYIYDILEKSFKKYLKECII